MMTLIRKMTDQEKGKHMDMSLRQIRLTQMVIVMEWMMMIADHRPESVPVK